MTEKFVPNVISIEGARVAFFRGHKAAARTGKDGKPKGDPKYSATLLLDPSNVAHAAKITEIKQEAARALNHKYGDKSHWPVNAGGAPLFLCFGLGNDLPKLGAKIYDGFADMFYVKLSDKNRPLLGNRSGKVVVEGDPQCPYSGCYVNAKTTLYVYDNESKGVNANFRSMQFVKDGPAFGGGGARSADEEFEALEGGNDAGKDPFDVE